MLGIYVLTSIPPISINQTFEELGLDVSIEQSNTIKLLFGILTDKYRNIVQCFIFMYSFINFGLLYHSNEKGRNLSDSWAKYVETFIEQLFCGYSSDHYCREFVCDSL